ncbi:UNVERIFIED_CONTAM: hypothetical protein Slati_2380200 [Sesamum latifolium]|uniref:Uncharacterized protein n=1 Tax=Sesamum latifolium TaxID=2727402 RepID=A0AAW2WAX8_9LAMI
MERFRDKERDDRKDKGNRENAPMKCVINTIVGGPVGGDSRRMRKKHGRNTREDRRTELIMNVEAGEEITFNRKDLNEGGGSQDDPMVIKLDIANFTVYKILVDNGAHRISYSRMC